MINGKAHIGLDKDARKSARAPVSPPVKIVFLQRGK